MKLETEDQLCMTGEAGNRRSTCMTGKAGNRRDLGYQPDQNPVHPQIMLCDVRTKISEFSAILLPVISRATKQDKSST